MTYVFFPFVFPGVRGLLGAPLLLPQVLARVRPAGAHPVAARAHPAGADRPHGLRLLHGRAHAREVPRRVLPVPAEEVSCCHALLLCVGSKEIFKFF